MTKLKYFIVGFFLSLTRFTEVIGQVKFKLLISRDILPWIFFQDEMFINRLICI